MKNQYFKTKDLLVLLHKCIQVRLICQEDYSKWGKVELHLAKLNFRG